MRTPSAICITRILPGLLLLAGCLMLSGLRFPEQQPAPGELLLHFRATVHGQPLTLHKQYASPSGESFQLQLFRFYVGKITAGRRGQREKTTVPANYRLVDFGNPNSTSIAVHLPPGSYEEIRLQLGIDSADQTGGIKTGALDPMKGMFWTWNSGYVSVKLEGSSAESPEPAHAFSYHLGGYRQPYALVKTLSLPLSGAGTFEIPKQGVISLDIPLELDGFFDGKTSLSIRQIPACTTPGALAFRLFENFTGLFRQVTISGSP